VHHAVVQAVRLVQRRGARCRIDDACLGDGVEVRMVVLGRATYVLHQHRSRVTKRFGFGGLLKDLVGGELAALVAAGFLMPCGKLVEASTCQVELVDVA